MKTTRDIRRAFRYGTMIFCSWLALVSGVAAQEIIVRDDATGGDCASIGTWDNASKTCVLTSDLILPVTIVGNNITLDGNGHSISGPGEGNGVTISGLAGIVIRNLVIEDFTIGIWLYQSEGTLIDGNTVRRTNWAVFVDWYSMRNRFIRNRIEASDIGMQICWCSQENLIESNIFEGNYIGVNLGYSYHNKVVNNAFLENSTQLASRGYVNLVEANYWSDFDTPAEGCFDMNSDGFCDAPYIVPGEMDALPATEMDVDTVPPVVYVEATPSVLTGQSSHQDVLITGYADDSKSGVETIVITVEDEYGIYDQVVAGFGSVVKLKAKALPKDYDGRMYTITATAVDAKGNAASATATVFVPLR